MATIRKDVVQLSIEINGVKAGQTYKELRNNARDLNRELDQLTPGTDEFIKKSGELKVVNNQLATIRNTTRGVANGFEEIPPKVNLFTDTIKKAGVAALAFFSAQQIIQWGKEFVGWLTKGAASLEAMQRKSRVVFGDSIDLVEDFAAINATSLGLTEDQYVSLAATIADILKPMGFQEEAAASMSSELLELTGALAEWDTKQRSSAEITEIVTKALTGEREGLKSLGIVITEAELTSRLLASGQSKLTGSALQQAKATETLKLIMEKSVDAQRAFATNQDSIARSGSRFSAVMEQIKEGLLKRFLPALRAIGNAAADVVAPLQRQSDLTATLQAQFNIQIETLQRGNISQENRAKLIGQINEKYKEYLPNLITEKTTLNELKIIQDDVNKAFTQRILLLATEESLRDVSQELIAAKTEELDLAQKLVAAENELAKFDINRVGQGREGQDQAFGKAALAANELTRQMAENRAEQDRLQAKFEATAKAARELGLDLDKILNPASNIDPVEPVDPGKKSAEKLAFEAELDRIELLTQRQIAANERIVQSDEVAAIKRQVIDSNSATLIAEARIRIFSRAKLEEERLSLGDIEKLKNENNQREIERIQLQSKLTLQERTELIEQRQQLEIQALDELELLEEQKVRRIAIINQQAELEIRRAKLETANLTGAELLAAQQAIADQERLVNKLLLEDQVATTNDVIEVRRNLLLAGIHQYQLDEVDLNTERQRINLEADIAIMQNRLSLYEQGSIEALKIETALADARAKLGEISFIVPNQGGGFSEFNEDFTDRQRKRQSRLGLSDDDFTKLLEREKQIRDFAIEGAVTVADTIFDIENERIDRQLQAELSSIDRISKAKLDAAGDDVVLQKKIIAEAERDRAAAEKKAARERKRIARIEAVIQGALAIVEALGDPITAAFAVPAAIIGTATQLAVIESQQFSKGGFTPKKGLYKDNTGHEVTGVVHDGEYILPKWMVNDPRTHPVINYFEDVRTRKRGFAEGGFTTVSTAPSSFVQTVSASSASDGEKRLIQLLEEIRSDIRSWPRDLKAHVVHSELEAVQDEINYIRAQANA